jgi:hypothetical protein
MGIARRLGNNDLCRQIQMAIETHQNKYAEKAAALFNKSQDGKDTNFDQIIDIS